MSTTSTTARSRPRHLRRRAVAGILAVLGALAVLPGTAHAGPYWRGGQSRGVCTLGATSYQYKWTLNSTDQVRGTARSVISHEFRDGNVYRRYTRMFTYKEGSHYLKCGHYVSATGKYEWNWADYFDVPVQRCWLTVYTKSDLNPFPVVISQNWANATSYAGHGTTNNACR